MNDPVSNRLERWKRSLIDLSARNRLLNFRPTPVTTVRIVNELPGEVFRKLVLEHEPMSFRPRPHKRSEKYDAIELQRIARDTLPKNQRDEHLQTELDEERLDHCLLRTYQLAGGMFEEQGINSLFLALGMLEWDEHDTLMKAPLVLLPVELRRQTARSRFTVKTTEDDPVLNPALVEKLRLDLHITLPPLPEAFEDFDPQDAFLAVREAVAQCPGWRVTNEINLGIFSFQKFVMYRDIENYQEIYSNHRVLRALCEGASVASNGPEIVKARLDEDYPPEQSYQILDADSSQQRAIYAVKAGHDLVLEGPPGTGKSQTIANLIAEAMAAGKQVLFVSEKMAALDVVYGRLETLGLHNFCLKLHSNKTNKRAVVEELARTLNRAAEPSTTDATLTSRLAELRAELNGYVKDLHEPFGRLAASPYQIIGEYCTVADALAVGVELDTECERDSFEAACRDLAEHTMLLGQIGDPMRHAWRGCGLQELSGALQDELKARIETTIAALVELDNQVSAYAQQVGVRAPTTFEETGTLCDVALLLARSPKISRAVLDDRRWDGMPPEALELIEDGRCCQQTRARVLRNFKTELLETGFRELNELLETGFEELVARYSHYCQSWSRFLKPGFWRDRNALRLYFREDYQPDSNERLLDDLRLALSCYKQQQSLRARDQLGRELFGEHWHCETSDWDRLKSIGEWLIDVRRYALNGTLTDAGVTRAAASLDPAETAARVGGLRRSVEQTRALVREFIAVAQYQEWISTDESFITLTERLRRLLAEFHGLRGWTAYQRNLQRCLSGPAGALMRKFQAEQFAPAQLERIYRRAFYRRWLDRACTERPRLGHFQAAMHEERLEEFRRTDRRLLEVARTRLIDLLYRRRDAALANLKTEMMTVTRELRKKARHLPLRQFLSRTPAAIRAIKPCFMMSPLSIAQFIDPAIHQFDLVIFDEASQIAPEDALGAIARGRQVVVVGDSKQLPPTNFFTAQITESADADEPFADEVESILDEFSSLGFLRLRLKWHYRSLHESLIAFSNSKFYDGELITFPAPGVDVQGGVQFVWVGGTYQGKGVNPAEAAAVADAVCQHARTEPHLSLGVGTFNINQQTLILDELEKRRREDPALEPFFTRAGENRFFVKNLENIQGDDRDVIFISTTYGPDSEGKLRHNFGPINGPNGWRRLNVILTRAKRTLKIFTSMRGDQIDLARVESDGARLLREYLLFAERGARFEPAVTRPAATERFQQSVNDALTARGLKLTAGVGQSEYRMDFAVTRSDREHFIAGIECDGASYASAQTARDRDRLRHEALTRLGWKIVRIWAAEWYHDHEAQIQRVLKAVDSIDSNN